MNFPITDLLMSGSGSDDGADGSSLRPQTNAVHSANLFSETHTPRAGTHKRVCSSDAAMSDITKNISTISSTRSTSFVTINTVKSNDSTQLPRSASQPQGQGQGQGQTLRSSLRNILGGHGHTAAAPLPPFVGGSDTKRSKGRGESGLSETDDTERGGMSVLLMSQQPSLKGDQRAFLKRFSSTQVCSCSTSLHFTSLHLLLLLMLSLFVADR